MDTSVREVLTKARDILIERGRCKGSFSAPGGKVCTYAAIGIAATGAEPSASFGWNPEWREELLKPYFAALGEPYVCQWNNTTDDETVIARFNEAIAHAV